MAKRMINKGVVFSGTVASVTRKTRMPKPKKTAQTKSPAEVRDGPWQGRTLYLSQMNSTLPMNICGAIGRYVYRMPNARSKDLGNPGLYWEGA